MSIVSGIFDRYRQRPLNHSQGRYENIYRQNAEHAQQFYDDFLHSLILPFSQRFDDPGWRDTLALSLESLFARRDIDFVAVDGTVAKTSFKTSWFSSVEPTE